MLLSHVCDLNNTFFAGTILRLRSRYGHNDTILCKVKWASSGLDVKQVIHFEL